MQKLFLFMLLLSPTAFANEVAPADATPSEAPAPELGCPDFTGVWQGTDGCEKSAYVIGQISCNRFTLTFTAPGYGANPYAHQMGFDSSLYAIDGETKQSQLVRVPQKATVYLETATRAAWNEGRTKLFLDRTTSGWQENVGKPRFDIKTLQESWELAREGEQLVMNNGCRYERKL